MDSQLEYFTFFIALLWKCKYGKNNIEETWTKRATIENLLLRIVKKY